MEEEMDQQWRALSEEILSGMKEWRLVLQLELRIASGHSPLVMTTLSNRLMVSAEKRPAEDLSMGRHLLPNQGPHQTEDLRERGRDQQVRSPRLCLNWLRLPTLGLGRRTFFSCSALARSAIEVAQNWDTKESVTWRYHPVQLLTSY